jgi:hypothetical protein
VGSNPTPPHFNIAKFLGTCRKKELLRPLEENFQEGDARKKAYVAQEYLTKKKGKFSFGCVLR